MSIDTTIAARAVKLCELLASWGHRSVVVVVFVVVVVVGGLPALVAEILRS